jgi:serine/threonine protein kinase/tetratricopeptide (TPR) repeat protein
MSGVPPETPETSPNAGSQESGVPRGGPANHIRARWANQPHSPPSLAEIARLVQSAETFELAEALAEDVLQRAARSMPATLEDYEAAIPAIRAEAEARRGILMSEVSTRNAEGIDRLRAELNRRFPDYAGDVDAVLEFASILAPPGATTPRHGQGSRLGKYDLLDRLGEGSFGEVWRAWDHELERYVALKLLLPHEGAGPRGLKRFIAEARAAAALDHEHVVAVHDAGRFGESGEYYIDSQLVGDPDPTPQDSKKVRVGRSLEKLVKEQGPLSPVEAARVIESVARGVAAAHARGTLHRDVKPANILITPTGRALVADFGLSTSGVPPRDGVKNGATVVLEDGRVVGTPAYMAPEQARGEPATPLCDVYSLGATLRFLLTGKPPYEPVGSSSDARWDVIEQVKRGAMTPVASARKAIPRSLAAVCDRATAASPDKRHTSAESLASDLRAFLEHRPTSAERAGPARVFALWYRRNALPATIALAAGVFLVAGGVRHVQRVTTERDRALGAEAAARTAQADAERSAAATAQARKEALAAADEARQAREIAEAVNKFLEDAFSVAQAGGKGRDAKLIDALAFGSSRIDSSLSDKPLVEAGVRLSIGRTYITLGMFEEAKPHVDRAVQLLTENLGPRAERTLRARRQQGEMLQFRGLATEARAALQSLISDCEQAMGPDAELTLAAVELLARVELSETNHDAAEALVRRVLEGRERTLPEGHADREMAMSSLCQVLTRRGRHEEAIPILRSIIESRTKRFGANNYYTMVATNDLGACLRDGGRADEGEPYLRKALAWFKAKLPAGHPNTLVTSLNLATLLLNDRHDFEEAAAIAGEAADASAKSQGAGASLVVKARNLQGQALTSLERFEEAEAVLVANHEQARKASNTADTVRAENNLVKLYEAWDKPELAARYRPAPTRPQNPPG